MVTCPNCGNQAGEGAVFCDRCGTRLPVPAAEPAVAPPPAAEAAAPMAEPAAQAVEPAPAAGSVICPACGAGNVPGEAFCDFCGSPLAAPLPDAAPAAPAEPAPPAEASAPPPAAGEARPVCPACGAEVEPGEAFCQNCGASLAQAPLPPEPAPDVELESPLPPEPVAPPTLPVVPVAVEPPPEPAPAPAPAAPAPAPAAPAGTLNCPACGAEIEAGDTFCSACGFALKPVAAPPAPAPAVAPAAPAPAAGPTATGPRLVLVASGAEIPLPAKDEILVGREDPVSGIYPEVDLTPHGGEDGGVSRRHARIIVEGGNYYVEDLDSTNFTFVNKQKVAPRTRQQFQPGDELRFGRVAMVLRA